ncbi:Fur family transcriptional regulator [Clostridium tepidum]|jgi:Fe2+ or Zn2+ uptake regulation protein|uniref:Transcriptional repressor n=1 Tax=Clostridium tepidum TaxID=1962263 RepID=A0A1S9I1L3_9CLOT|nr:transcriptional repressor [Clostridium tepidum]MCR1935171.1 transcriptional repressor [Clostridium tepidum]MDU6877241.1 transcriptional repressor [Clostridium botulinum]OOO63106.1 transcriptional repressor [Clostridium tepidum]OOO64234.1 transcriptional repressor [Clostridium tepidum]
MIEEDLLKKNNLKVTKGRINILNILMVSNYSLDVESIVKKLQDRNIKLDLSTIYRTLEIFLNKDLIEKFDLGNAKYNFRFKRKKHTHTIQCKVCHKEVQIECPLFHIDEIVNKETGFSSIDHQLKIEGVCENCNKYNCEK